MVGTTLLSNLQKRKLNFKNNLPESHSIDKKSHYVLNHTKLSPYAIQQILGVNSQYYNITPNMG